MYPSFRVPPHFEYIAGLLEKVERGEEKRLIISVHPGSGKSTLLQLFAGWYLGRNPANKIISTSAAEGLVVRNSRATWDLFSEPEWPFDARLAADATVSARNCRTVFDELFLRELESYCTAISVANGRVKKCGTMIPSGCAEQTSR